MDCEISIFNSRGDRDGVDNKVILLTDGGSNIDATNTIPRARDLKNRGVEIYVVAIGDQVNDCIHKVHGCL